MCFNCFVTTMTTTRIITSNAQSTADHAPTTQREKAVLHSMPTKTRAQLGPPRTLRTTPRTRDAQHPGPAPFPREGCRVRREGRPLSCACLGHLPHEVSCFIAPPASSFSGHHSQPTAPDATTSGYFASLSLFAWSSAIPSTSAVCGCGCLFRIPSKHGTSWANTSMRRSSAARTLTFLSRRYAWNWTRAPASRHILASIFSVGVGRLRVLPVRVHAAR